MYTAMQHIHRTNLKRLDAITFEQHLREAVQAVVPFESHSITFPKQEHASHFSYEAKEKRLFLPLPDDQGKVLCVFVARGVKKEHAKALPPLWSGVAKVISQNLLHYKRSLSDPTTGLFTRHYLLSCLEKELHILRHGKKLTELPANNDDTPLQKNKLFYDSDDFAGRGAVGILVIRFASLRDIVREYGYQFADTLMVALADTLKTTCPEQTIAARTGDSEFAIIVPAATKTACTKLASSLVSAFNAVHIEHPLRHEQVGTAATVGFILYPQDTTGVFYLKELAEQARLLLRKARLASALAGEQKGDWNSIRNVMPFGSILAQGGRVVEVLPLSRVVVSLGLAMHAREGLRFSVWATAAQGHPHSKSPTPLYKGEISLTHVQENSTQAEVLYLGDPAWEIEAGDRLALLPEEQGTKHKENINANAPAHDPVTEFLRYGDFLAQWAEAREKTETFSLALLRLALNTSNDEESTANPTDTSAAEIATMLRETFGSDVIAGRCGVNSLILFHPDTSPEQLQKIYFSFTKKVQKHLDITLAIGIAPYPYLEYRRVDALENSRKALEYAMLLPAPHVGVLDSLAINISADKKYSQGDTFGAIKEFKVALLADEANTLAWNSLGVCLAGLGKFGDAEEFFTTALTHSAKDSMALYNLGQTYQAMGDTHKAKKTFSDCLKHDPKHLFALNRLGQLEELSGNKERAKKLYEQAAELPGGKGLTHRNFARLALDAGKEDEAREHLHEALLHDPQDAVALQLFARICLDAGEDPEMSISFARQAVSLRPELRAGWLELARALEASGKQDDARQARIRAGAV